ncbi:MAG: type II toxin-antitoxin system VapC family toxin [Candidatus Bathyarchaeia archaeon]|nr:type II toxin-antitoxin system VapC family toxin [Candidatus Bathyarchaeota archaeon]
MRYLADTVYLIDLVNGDEGAVALAKELDEIGEPVGLSTISAEEYFRGVFYLYWDDERVLKAKLADARRDLSAFEILPITYDIAVKAAEVEVATVKNGVMISLADILIASSAISHDSTLITRNVKHFQRVPKLNIRSY